MGSGAKSPTPFFVENRGTFKEPAKQKIPALFKFNRSLFCVSFVFGGIHLPLGLFAAAGGSLPLPGPDILIGGGGVGEEGGKVERP